MAPDTVQGKLDQLDQHADEAERLELDAAAAAVLTLQNWLRGTSQWLAAQWVRRFGSLMALADPFQSEVLLGELKSRIAAARIDPTPILLKWADRALSLGVSQASDELGFPVHVTADVSQHSLDAIARASEALSEHLRKADRLLSLIGGSQYQDFVSGFAAAHGAVAELDRAARWVTNREINNGGSAVADSVSAGLLWVAERNACVVCLALSGEVADSGGSFDANATFGAKPIPVWPPGDLQMPPRHPHCRCRVTPWQQSSVGTDSIALPDALKREARRSILKGWSLPSESEGLRLKAADRLLQQGAGLPKSVEQQAQRAVRRGYFASRSVPTG